MNWFAFELRWRDALLAALLPAGPARSAGPGHWAGQGHAVAQGLPGIGELDLREFWREFAVRAPWTLRVGLRAIVWTLTWLPVCLGLGLRPLHRLSPARQQAFLQRLADSRLYLLRQLPATLKVVAAFGYFADPAVRAAFELAAPNLQGQP